MTWRVRELVDRRLDRLGLPLAGALADALDAVVGVDLGEHPVAPAGADQVGLDPGHPAVWRHRLCLPSFARLLPRIAIDSAAGLPLTCPAMIVRRFTLAAMLLLALVAPLEARVERVEITARGLLAGGAPFGEVGPYERIDGRLHYAIDPTSPANARIVDLDLAPRDARGLVTFAGDFRLLRPADLARGNHRLLYEVDNRGNLGMLAFFNDAPWDNDPRSLADLGSGFLLRQGYSLLWAAWNWDVLPGEGRLQIELPVATEQGAPITGPLAAEFVLMQPATQAPFMWGDSRGYPPADLHEPGARLTVRDAPDGPRTTIPRERWRFADPTRGQLPRGLRPRPHLRGGLHRARPARRRARPRGDPRCARVLPLRRHGRDGHAQSAGGDPEAALAFGISQSGRVLQHMLLEALHVDEASRMVFDGALIHVAGGGKGSFNHRFAQTTRHPSHLEDQQYPADFFPFTTVPQHDPVTGQTGDVLARARAAGAVPKLFYTMTSTEYWTRSASLLHTDVAGTRDLPLAPDARLYMFAGAQHGNWRSPDARALPELRQSARSPPADARAAARPRCLGERRRRTAGQRLSAARRRHARLDRRLARRVPGSPGRRPARGQPAAAAARSRAALREPRASSTASPPASARRSSRACRCPMPTATTGAASACPRWRCRSAATPAGTCAAPEVGAPDRLARWSGSFLPFSRRSLAARYASRDGLPGSGGGGGGRAGRRAAAPASRCCADNTPSSSALRPPRRSGACRSELRLPAIGMRLRAAGCRGANATGSRSLSGSHGAPPQALVAWIPHAGRICCKSAIYKLIPVDGRDNVLRPRSLSGISRIVSLVSDFLTISRVSRAAMPA